MYPFHIEEPDPNERHRAEIIKLCRRLTELELRSADMPDGPERDAILDAQIKNIKQALLILDQYPEIPTPPDID